MTTDEQIKQLQTQISELNKIKEAELKEKYQYLVGKCFHRAHTSYEKITEVNFITENTGGNFDVHYYCIKVYFDNRGEDYNSNASIELSGYGEIESDDIEIYEISKDVFEQNFTACYELIKSKI